MLNCALQINFEKRSSNLHHKNLKRGEKQLHIMEITISEFIVTIQQYSKNDRNEIRNE